MSSDLPSPPSKLVSLLSPSLLFTICFIPSLLTILSIPSIRSVLFPYSLFSLSYLFFYFLSLLFQVLYMGISRADVTRKRSTSYEKQKCICFLVCITLKRTTMDVRRSYITDTYPIISCFSQIIYHLLFSSLTF